MPQVHERRSGTLNDGRMAVILAVADWMYSQGRIRAWRTPGRHLRFSPSDCLEFSRSLGKIDVEGDAAFLVGRAGVTAQPPGGR